MSEPTIDRLLRWGMATLAAHSDEAWFEIEQIMQYALVLPRHTLHLHADRHVSRSALALIRQLVAKRCQGLPLAYLLRCWNFLGREFVVNEHTLIPRVATELLVTTVVAQHGTGHRCLQVADLGTGSGVVGLSLALRWPSWQVWLTDRDAATLQVAQRNARRLGCFQVRFSQGYWCNALPHHAWDLLISNPPYIASGDPHLPALRHEPSQALVSGVDGLQAIRALVLQGRRYLKAGGWLYLEHGHTQAEQVKLYLHWAGFMAIATYGDHDGCQRISCGQWPGS